MRSSGARLDARPAREAFRVLHVTQPTIGGVARAVADLVEDQLARGLEVMVASPRGAPLEDWVRAAGAEHIEWRASRAPGPSSAREAMELRRLADELDPAVVHLHSSKAGLAGRPAARGDRLVLFQPHGWSFYATSGTTTRLAIWWERWSSRWADATICVSRDELQAGVDVGIRSHWIVVPNGVSLDRIGSPHPDARRNARRQLRLDASPLACCVGRLDRAKGQDVLLDAWHRVLQRLPNARLALVGDGPDLLQLASREIPGVMITGWTDDVIAWIDAANVVVVPSRWEAGLSISTMEAMARARCVIATDVPGMRANIAPDAGEIVPVEDPGALGDALIERLEAPGDADAEGLNGRRTIEDRFDLRSTAETMFAVYKSLLGTDDDRRPPGSRRHGLLQNHGQTSRRR